MINNMTKSKLLSGDVVISKKGWQGVVLRGTACGDVIKWFKNSNGEIIAKYRYLNDVREDLTYSNTKIVKVYRCDEPGLLTSCEVVNDRFLFWEDAKEMTLSEIEQELGYKVKIVGA